MKIVIVGASGTMGSYLSNVFEKDHEVIRVDRRKGDIQVDITSTESIKAMYQKIGAFDALICTAGPTFVGPWKTLTDQEFRQGVEGKMMGQINLVLIGQRFINPKGSFTLITGDLTHEPQKKLGQCIGCKCSGGGFCTGGRHRASQRDSY